MKKIILTIILIANLPVVAATGFTPVYNPAVSMMLINKSNKNKGWQRYYESKYQICKKHQGGNACKKYREKKNAR